MQPEKLTIEIKPKDKKPDSDNLDSPTSPSIEVVHNRPTPPLQSILKQRTVSESSEDPSSLAASTASIVSLDDDNHTDDNDENSSSTDRRRTVSFNSRVDSACFKSNESVSSMAPTLKNRRRKARKREEKRCKIREERRIRKLSTGSEGSGDEHLTRESLSDSQYSVSEEEEDSGKKDQLMQRSVSDPGPDREGEGSDKVKVESSDQAGTVFTTEDEVIENPPSASDDSDSKVFNNNSKELDFRTNESGENSVENEEGEKKVTWNEKVTKEIQSKLESGKVVDKNDNEADDSDDDDEDDAEQVNASVGHGGMNGHADGGDQRSGKVEKSDVETMLSWDEGPKVNGGEHASQCAFEFSNTVMFDLDVD